MDCQFSTKTGLLRLVVLLGIVLTVGSACSINRFVVRTAANALAGDGGADVFMSENDPDLVGEALPFVLKVYDALLAQDPTNRQLLLAAGSGYISYANAFLQTPAEMLDIGEFERAEHLRARAKNLYLRGRDMVLTGLELQRPGVRAALANPDAPLDMTRQEDVPYLYWAGAGWMGAYSTDPFDLELGLSVGGAGRLMARAFELDPGFQDGAIYEFYVSYYGALPETAGGDKDRAREFFRRAVEVTNGQSAGPYLALATTVSVAEQRHEEFVELLEAALQVDLDARPGSRLVNVLHQRRARWLLANVEEFFLLPFDESEFDESEFDDSLWNDDSIRN